MPRVRRTDDRLKISDLKDLVTIQAQTEVKDTHGGFVEGAPTDLYRRLPAAVEQLMGRELEVAAAVDPRVRVRVRIRYIAALTNRRDLIVVHHAHAGDIALEVLAPPMNVGRHAIPDDTHLMCGAAV